MIVSAGGVVIKDRSVLLLQTRKGQWVLPKGHVEQAETFEEAALREVAEEAGIQAEILEDLGIARYHFCVGKKVLHKKVYWYKMTHVSGELLPQREEGFVDIRFIPEEELPIGKMYGSELKMVQKALS